MNFSPQSYKKNTIYANNLRILFIFYTFAVQIHAFRV